ncbi:hypothetical protein ABFU82_20010 [Nocardioides sp. WV_118_6]
MELPQGVCWFSGASPSIALSVSSGASPGASTSLDPDQIPAGSALDNALGWVHILGCRAGDHAQRHPHHIESWPLLLPFEEPIDSALFDYFHPEITQ